MKNQSKRTFLKLSVGGAAALAIPSWAQTAPWSTIEANARGKTVYFNAWGGSERINVYLQWVAAELVRRYGVQLQHVKLTDTVDAVKRVRTELAAGKRSGGSIDMMWINGENFLTMKREGLLHGPFAEQLPNFEWVDTVNKPTTRFDFGEPTAGLEAPWGMAQFTFFGDRRQVTAPPQNIAELLSFAQKNPGRVTYPRPPAFIGTTFLKQVLLETTTDRAAFYRPHDASAFGAATAGLWKYLDRLHPSLWRQGKQFPATPAAQRQMVADGELFIGLTFNPNEAANEIAAKRLPTSVFSWQLAGGTLGNTHFLAIPVNASASDAARVAINFLMSPEAQARKADIRHWGDQTVLDTARLPADVRALFSATSAPGTVEVPRPVLLEPHASWVDPIEKEWVRRYAVN